MEPEESSQGYSAQEVQRIVGITRRTLELLVDERVLQPGSVRPDAASAGAGGAGGEGPDEARFSFRDLVLLRSVKQLEDSAVSQARLRVALREMRRRLPGLGRDQTVRLGVDRGDVVVYDEQGAWLAKSGQELLEFDADVAELRTLKETTTSAQELYELAGELEGDDVKAAIAAYLRVLELDPEHADCHLDLGRLQHEAGELRIAERHYRSALEIRPGDATASFNLGVALEDRGELDEAKTAYEGAVGDPACAADAYFNLARIHETLGERAEALACLQRYRALRSS